MGGVRSGCLPGGSPVSGRFAILYAVRRWYCTIAAVLVLVGAGVVVLGQDPVPLEMLDGQGEVLDLEALEREVWAEVNRYRVEKGLSELTWDQDLAEVARDYSRTMLVRADLEHDVGGTTTAERLRSAGVDYLCACENLSFKRGFNIDPANRAVTGWIYSQEHRENMLNRCVTGAGAGIAASPTGGFYVTWIARRPLS